MFMRKIVPVLFVCGGALAGCGDDTSSSTPPSTSASALAPSIAAESRTLAKMSIDPSGVAMFDMKAPLENIKGTVKGFGGDIDVELKDLTKSRGEITIDVTTLETHTFGEEGKDQTQSRHAHTWLEVGEKTDPALKEKHKVARFAIREIVGVSQADVTKLTGDSRDVTLTAKGDFLLHGRSVAITLELSCAFLFDGDKLKGISIKSSKPATVNLKAHGVEARNDAGEAVVAKTLELFGSKVADDASVTFEVMARPRGERGLLPAPPPSASASAAASAAASAPSGAASK